MIKCTKYAYTNDQRIKTNQNQYFVFRFTSLPVLTGFSTVILTLRWWLRMLTDNPKPSYEQYYSNLKFQVNRIKTVTVTVPSFFRNSWQVKEFWLHIIVQMFPLAQMVFGTKKQDLAKEAIKISFFKMAAGGHIGLPKKHWKSSNPVFSP